jgi:hypothetical protein
VEEDSAVVAADLVEEGLVAVEGDLGEESVAVEEIALGEESDVAEGMALGEGGWAAETGPWVLLEGALVVVPAKLGASEAARVEGGSEKDLVGGERDLLEVDLVAVCGGVAAVAPPQGQ